MGLDDFKKENSQSYQRYKDHYYNEKLEKWREEFDDRFPVELNIEFVEVSPQMTKTWGKAYRRDGDTYYIRLSKEFVESKGEEQIRRTLLHEMVHVYFYQIGYGNTNHDKYFRWVCGRVGADMTNMDIHNLKWIDCIEPFLEE